mgnify:CR=1 FL=1
MITDKIYQQQIERLEGALNFKLYEGSYKVWKTELDENGYSDERLIKGISRIINRLSEGSLKPRDCNLGTILGACKSAHIEPALLPSMPLTEVTNPNRQGLSPYAQGCCEIIQAYTTGLIDKITFNAKHAELNKRHHVGLRHIHTPLYLLP